VQLNQIRLSKKVDIVVRCCAPHCTKSYRYLGALSSHFIGKYGSIFDNHETANQKAQELFRAKIENESKYIKATISEKV